MLATVLMLGLFTLGGVAWAQIPQTDDPVATPDGGASVEGWMVQQIPGLPTNAKLGDVWVAPNGEVFVWASWPVTLRGATGSGLEPDPDPEEEGRQPGGNPTGSIWNSAVWRFDGVRWTYGLSRTGEMGTAIYGYDSANLWATTRDMTGEARVFRFDGSRWNPVPMVGYLVDEHHSLAGVPGNMYLRVGNVVLRDDGRDAFYPVYEQPGGVVPSRGLVELPCGCVMAATPDGLVELDGAETHAIPAGFDFGGVQDLWATRNAQGTLEMFLLGSDVSTAGIRMWKYTETDSVTHAGTWGGATGAVVADPAGPGTPGAGMGFHVVGFPQGVAYVTGTVWGEAHLICFDGSSWCHLAPPTALETVHGVWGNSGATGDTVWFSADHGRMVRYVRANRAPDLSHAVFSLTSLWPANGHLEPVHIDGILDPDGDPFTVQIEDITQDEDPKAPVSTGRGVTCPDAVLQDSVVLLRAEHLNSGDGRVYQIEFTATDRAGSSSRGTLRICVPIGPSDPCDNDLTPYASTTSCFGIVASSDGWLQAEKVGDALEVRYGLPQAGPVHLGLYDLSGRCVGTVEDGVQGPGDHAATWNLDHLRPGLYFLKLRTGDQSLTRRVLLIR